MNFADILNMIGGCAHEITVSYGLYASLFLAGLVGGFTHCVAMCGPFVLSQTGHMSRPGKMALLPYHIGRITTYVVMAVLLSSVLNLAFLFLPIRSFVVAPILMLAGVIFLVTAMPQLSKIFPWVGAIRFSVPYRFIAQNFETLSRKDSALRRYGMGVLLGFMPCGMIVAALMAATTATHPLQAGLAMAAFGVGTMPALVILAFGARAVGHFRPVLMGHIRRGMMIWSGLWLFLIAGFVLV